MPIRTTAPMHGPETAGLPSPGASTSAELGRWRLSLQGPAIGLVALVSAAGAMAADLHPSASVAGDVGASILVGAGVVG
ncbi:MAG: hypothetical protein ABIP36_07470, partial [Acidimicrobiales bacterium]